MFDVEGKVVAITGASSGIGEAAGRLLAASGAKVVLGAPVTHIGAAASSTRSPVGAPGGWSSGAEPRMPAPVTVMATVIATATAPRGRSLRNRPVTEWP